MGGAGSRLNCAGKSKKTRKKRKKDKKLASQLEEQQGEVDELRNRVAEFSPKLSSADSQLLEDKLRNVERRHSELVAAVERRERDYGALGGSLGEIQEEAQRYLSWLSQQEQAVTQPQPLSLDVQQASSSLQQVKELCRSLAERQSTLEAVIAKTEAITDELPAAEKETVEQLMASVQLQHSTVSQLVTAHHDSISQQLEQRVAFQASLEKERQRLEASRQATQPLHTIRLTAADVDKQADKCKSLAAKLQTQRGHLEELASQARELQDQCGEEDAAQIAQTISDLEQAYEELDQWLKDKGEHYRDRAASRRVFEADLQKVDHWCKETEFRCEAEVPPDCAVEVLEEQHKQFKTLSNTAQLFGSLVSEIKERGSNFAKHLGDTDKQLLEDELELTEDKYNRASTLISERLSGLEAMLTARRQTEASLEASDQWLSNMAAQISSAVRPIGPTTEDAELALQSFEKLESKLEEYQPTMTELSSSLERLRSEGRTSDAEAVLRLTEQYELLIDRVTEHRQHCQAAIALRQALYDHAQQMDDSLRELEDQTAAISELGIAMPDRVVKYKAILEKLVELEPELVVAGDRAAQVAKEGSPDEADVPEGVARGLQERAEALRSSVETRIQQCHKIQQERLDFESSVSETMAWLEQKEDQLASCGPQEITAEKVTLALKRHQTLCQEAAGKLETIKEKARQEREHYQELGEALPPALADKLDQIEVLDESIRTAMEKKEQYLVEAQTDRAQYDNSIKQVQAWLHGAEELLDSGYEGLDYDTIDQQLSEYTDYFSEASLCQDELEQVVELSERLIPTLDENDRETLQQSLDAVQSKLAAVVDMSQKRQELLEGKAGEWRRYQDNLAEFGKVLQGLETEWEEATKTSLGNPDSLPAHLTSTKDFLEKLESHRHTVDELNEQSRSLDRFSNSNSRIIINRLMMSLNGRWNTIVQQAETRQLSLEELSSQWQDFSGMLTTVEGVVTECSDRVVSLAPMTLSQTELQHQADVYKEVEASLERVQPQVELIKRANEMLQRSLPTAEAKVNAQERLMAVLEKYERLQDEVQELQAVLGEELEDREGYLAEATRTLTWFQQTAAKTDQVDGDSTATASPEVIETHRVLEQEVILRLEQMRQLGQQQEAKYAQHGVPVPQVLAQRMEKVEEKGRQLEELMRRREEELLHLAEDRREYRSALAFVTARLATAHATLQERVVSIPDSQRALQNVTSTFEEVKEGLARLRNKGSDVIQHSSDAEEKTSVQQTLSDVNRQWLAVQAEASEKGRQLTEAAELWRTVEESTCSAEQWADQAECTLGEISTWSDFREARENLQTSKALRREAEQHQARLAKLEPVLQHLAQLCSTSVVMETVGIINHRLRGVAGDSEDRTHNLEAINAQIQEYERDMAEAAHWLDQARITLLMKNSTHELKDQLESTEKLVEDAIVHKARAEQLLARHADLRRQAGDSQTAQECTLVTEMAELVEAAKDKENQLRQAVREQEQYESEIRHLNAAIQEAQGKLLASPVRASSVEALKQQIAEHDALANQIKTYQSRVNEINELSRKLMERTMHLTPSFTHHDYVDMRTSGPLTGWSHQYPHLRTAAGEFDDSGLASSMQTSSAMSLSSAQPSISTSSTPRGHRQQALDSLLMASFDPRRSSLDAAAMRSEEEEEEVDAPDRPETPDRHFFKKPRSPRDLDLDVTGIRGISSLSSSTENVGSRRSESPSLERTLRSHYVPPQMRSLSALPVSSAGSSSSVHAGSLTARSLQDSSHLAPDAGEEPRQRSASFGAAVRPVGAVLKSDSELAELNKSWGTLQMQVAAKERELQAALAKQQEYQGCVSELTARMERAHATLARTPYNTAEDIDRQMREYKEALLEVEAVREEVERVKEQGRQIMEQSDSEGFKTMEATLKMLGDRSSSLHSLAQDRGKQLQDAMRHKEKHDLDLKAYGKRVKEMADWLSEMRVRHAPSILPTEGPEVIQEMLQENRELQEELSLRLQQVSDLAVQCDALCELETPAAAEKLRSQLAELQKELGEFKLAAIDKHGQLRQAAKEAEKRRREMDDYESSVHKLQQWITDTKQRTMAPVSTPVVSVLPDQHTLHQGLVSGLSEHRQLMRQISETSRGMERSSGAEEETATLLEESELTRRWEAIQRDLAHKRHSLEDLVRTRGDPEGGTLHLSTTWTTVTEGPRSRGDIAEMRDILGELKDCWQQLTSQVEDRQLRLSEVLGYQQQYQDALQGISSWLDTAQHRLFAPDPSISTQQQLQENENLQREIKALQEEITAMSRQAQELLSSTSQRSQTLIQQTLSHLNARVSMLETQAQQQGEELRRVDGHWQIYQRELAQLQSKLAELQKLLASQTPGASVDARLTSTQRLESQLAKCEDHLEQLKRRETEIAGLYPQGAFPSQIPALQSTYMDLQRKVLDRKADLLQSVSVHDQYEKMLKDYSQFLDTAETKLDTDAISAADLSQLRQQLNSHKDFFSDLEVHKGMLDSLANQCDQATRERLHVQHARLANLTDVLVDKANLHGQRLERLIRQWADLEAAQKRLAATLADIERQIPRPITGSDTLTSIQDKLNMYRRLQVALAGEKAAVFQVVDGGKSLLHSLHCPTLESAIADLGDKWVDLNATLTQELKKAETVGDQLQTMEAEAAVLASWLVTARSKLTSLKQLSDKDLQSIAAIRTKVEKLLEFQKEVDGQHPLVAKVQRAGRQLAANQTFNTAGLEERLSKLDNEWAQLQHDIEKAKELLHQAQMELMPSRQALRELEEWMEQMRRTLREDRNKPIRSHADIDLMLRRYKGHKIELASKQMTMDFVNQSVLQPKPFDSDSPREKQDFANKLREHNKRWEGVCRDVEERLLSLEGLTAHWEQYEAALNKMQSWFAEQEAKLCQYKLMGNESAVRHTLRDCKSLQQLLKSKEGEIERVKELGAKLLELSSESPGCQRSVQESLDSLNKQWLHLEEQLLQLENLLEDVLAQWGRYGNQLQEVQQVLAQTEYCLNRYNTVGGDISTLRSQTEKLKALERDMQQRSGQQKALVTLGSQLTKVCEAPAQAEIKRTIAEVDSKWKQLYADLVARSATFEACLGHWEQFEAEYRRLKAWLEEREKQAGELVGMREDSAKRQECLDLCKKLLRELDAVQSDMSSLCKLTDTLTKDMNTSSIVLITSRQSSLEQRMLALRQLVSSHIGSLQDDLSQMSQFRQAFDTVHNFLSHAQTVLTPPDPGKTAEEEVLKERLDQLKELLLQFNNMTTRLDALNDLGYRLALQEPDALRLRELNHRWQRLFGDTNERCRTLQASILSQQDFTAKCETWMAFLASTEHDLAREIAGNLADLQDQQRRCEKFESEMYSREQVLHSIIADGDKMMRAGDVEDREEFQRKLQLLSEQWQSVVRRAAQRKAIIDSTVKKWQAFNSLSEAMRAWLARKEATLRAFEFDTVSIQTTRNLLEKVKNLQSEFKLQEGDFQRVGELGRALLAQADDKASEEIRVCQAQLQHNWHQVLGALSGHCVRLEEILQLWRDCEEDIEEILAWLRETRTALSRDLPTEYDQLQSDLRRCQDIETAFANSEDRRQQLVACEARLRKVVQPEDLNILHQRLRLLNKQWDELSRQAAARAQRLQDAMFHWSDFGQRVRELLEWIAEMERRIMTTKNVSVEDLLHKLETEYRAEMAEREREKERLVEQGQQLMQVSSQVRSADIEQRISRLEDKWQHLRAVTDFRERKLQETVLAVKQLDASMRNLSQWLTDMEQELSATITYSDCDMREIQRKLEHQQELQRDIERHSAGVASVLNLCEVLLHDSDACPTEVEFNALQHSMKSLDRRWRQICSLSPDRRAKIETTWQIWESYREECTRMCEWLRQVETEIREFHLEHRPSTPRSTDTTQLESLQKRVHERMADVENINKQYRKLSREGRCDAAGNLKQQLQEMNDRWEGVQQQLSTLMQELRQSASVQQEFHSKRSSLLQWLTEVDMQLTNIEHLYQMDIHTKMKEMKRILEEIEWRRNNMASLDQAALYLMQHGDPGQAQQVQRDLDEFKDFSRRVLDRATAYQTKLQRIDEGQVEDIAKIERGDVDVEEPWKDRELRMREATLEWDNSELEAYLKSSPPDTSPLHSPPQKRRASPRAVLRRRSPSPSKWRDSASPRRRSVSPVRRARLDVVDSGSASLEAGSSKVVEVLLERLAEALEDAAAKLMAAEQEMKISIATRETDTLLLRVRECEKAMETVQSLERLLKTESRQSAIASVDSEIRSVTTRWELLQTRLADRQFQSLQQRQDLQQFRTDLANTLAWLDEAEALQAVQRPLPSDVIELNSVTRQYKDFLLQMETKKARVLSIKLLSKNYIDESTAQGRQMREQVRQIMRRWDALTSRAATMQADLQVALIQCQEFHHEIHDLLLWLESIETRLQRCEPIYEPSDPASLWDKYHRLKDIHGELEARHPRVVSLKDTADQLLEDGTSEEMVQAKSKMHIIANRLRALLRLSASYIQSLESKLDISGRRSLSTSLDLSEGHTSGLGSSRASRSSTPRLGSLTPSLSSRTRSPFAFTRQLLFGSPRPLLRGSSSPDSATSSVSEEEATAVVGRRSFLSRVVRTAIPLQLLLLLLLGIACLVPMTDEDYCCVVTNNFKRSLAPMLRYTDGPPPA